LQKQSSFTKIVPAVASIGLAVLGTDLSTLFSDLGKKLALPSGF